MNSHLTPLASAMQAMRTPQKDRLKAELSRLPQYEPITSHRFHGGMYVREVWRGPGVLVVGKVHKKPHFYEIVSGTVSIDGAPPVTGPLLMLCEPGTQRAVLSLTPVLCRTFHKTDATSPEEAEAELVEDDPESMYDAGNKVKPGVLKHEPAEMLS